MFSPFDYKSVEGAAQQQNAPLTILRPNHKALFSVYIAGSQSSRWDSRYLCPS
jgi:hypothetical protein